ncbi:O-methyltransferase [Bacillus tianshenii]|nr:O-methyltransferase [Bacillus tianshenii]
MPIHVQQYVEELIPARDGLLQEMEQFAKENHVPIMELIGIETMLSMLRMKQPKRILEVGTAIGYSAIRMAKALPHAEIVTLERDEERYKQALHNIEQAGLTSRIHVLFGDALDQEQAVKEYAPFDCIFIDAAKGQYQRFFEMYTPFLTDNGVVLSDNVLFKGFVANGQDADKRMKKIADKIRGYNTWLVEQSSFDTTILPVGDGIAVSTKR